MISFRISFVFVASCAVMLASALARAQSFNLDVDGTPSSLPGPSYRAAAGQPGTWVGLPTPPASPAPLNDIHGAATPVTITITSGGGVLSSTINLGGASANEIALLSDIFDTAPTGTTWTIANLSPGEYAVYTYAMAPDNGTYRTNVSVSSSPDPLQAVGGSWTNAYVLGVTHAVHHVTATTSPIVITTAPAPIPVPNFGSIAGFQIVKLAELGRFCAGDGLDGSHTTACPCGNVGAQGHGCANSANAQGAELVTTGTTSANDVVLHGSGMPATSSCIYLQGDGTADTVFGDGVRCTGGALVRLRSKSNSSGTSSFPDSVETVTLSQRGGVTVGSGAVRYYQTYYRNASAAFCPPQTFNVTNGWILIW